MSEPTFPQKIHLSVPVSLRERVQEAARDEGTTVSEFIRQAIRAQLKGADMSQSQQAVGN